MTRFIAATALLASLSLAACTPAADGNASVAADTDAIANSLREQEAQWNRDFASRDAAAIAGHYAADAAFANPGAPLATGAAVRSVIEQVAADPALQIEFASDRVQVAASGDLAYTRGRYTMRFSDPATRQPRTDSGNYLTVWQRQQDGSWKAVEDFLVPGAPAAAPAAAAPAPAPAAAAPAPAAAAPAPAAPAADPPAE